MNCFVTGVEMWFHYAKTKNKRPVKAVETGAFPPPVKFKLSSSADQVMLVAFLGFTWHNTGALHAKMSN